MELLNTDILVIGKGIAGLMASWCARKSGAKVIVLGLGGGASGWLQGVNIALGHADPTDSPKVHAQDLLREGCHINDPELVHDTVEAAIPAFLELVNQGVEFAREDGIFLQRLSSGSTYPRCCYVPAMMWGPKAARVLSAALKANGVEFMRLRAIRLFAASGRVCGVVAVSPRGRRVTVIGAKAVIMASGGVGGLFARSTYPNDVAGSTYAMAAHVGAALADMEFIQFEPLVGFNPAAIRGYVIPTTLFGDGATMRDVAGRRFLLESRPQGEAGIGKEDLVRQMARMREEARTLKSGGVWLDATTVSSAALASYPWLSKFMRRHSIDMTRDKVEVWPAAHTCLGGLIVDRERHSTVPGLYAVGEAAAGVHGAGRLAGGSGTDVLASGYIAGKAAAEAAKGRFAVSDRDMLEAMRDVVDPDAPVCCETDESLTRTAEEAADILAEAAGMVRDGEALECASRRLDHLLRDVRTGGLCHPAAMRLRVFDRLLVSDIIVKAALRRRESRGAHLRRDFPECDERFSRSLLSALPDVQAEMFLASITSEALKC